jgi:hypothetical protein
VTAADEGAECERQEGESPEGSEDVPSRWRFAVGKRGAILIPFLMGLGFDASLRLEGMLVIVDRLAITMREQQVISEPRFHKFLRFN